MPGINLTRVEASERAAIITTREYAVDLDLTQGEETFRSVTVARFDAKAGASTFIDLIAPAVHSIKLNGVDLDPLAVYHDSRIALENLAEHNELEVVADCAYMHTGEGLHRFVDPADGLTYLYSQFEVPDSRRVFTVFEQPDLKASFTFTVKTPESWTVFSNSPTPTPVAEQAGTHTFHFAPTRPLSSYVTAIVAGPYVGATDTYVAGDGRQVELGTYCRRSLAEHMDSEEILNLTKAGFEYFEQLFGTAYPFEKYDQIFVPEFNAGAMENAGCVTHRDDYIFRSRPIEALVERRAVTILHELAHMWFGDMVTMKWWNDLWLNESFAEYTSTLAVAEATRWSDAWTTFQTIEKGWAYNQDQLSSTHPVAAEIKDLHDVEVNFDGITYAKGASVLKQLVAYVGFDTFIEAARVYFKRFEWGNTSLNDFLQVLNEVSGRDMQAWADAWLQTSGVSGLGTKRVYGEDGQLTDLILTQELPAQQPAGLGRPHVAKLETFALTDGKLISTGVLSLEYPAEPVSEYRVELTDEQKKLVGEADLLMLNAEDHTYAKVALTDEDGLQAAIEGVSTLESALSRGLIWGSLWENVRDARLPVTTYVDAVVRNVSKEPSASLLGTMVNNSQVAIATFSAPTGRERLYDALYDAFSAALAQAKPGSDEQLILLRGLISVSTNATKGEELCRDIARGAFEDTTGDIADATGIPYDQNLGWSALGALASRNLVTVEELERASKYSPSSISSNGYAYAVAALPNAERKAAAYKTIMDDESLSNDALASTINGYVRGPVELREQYYGPYFEALLGVWESRSIGMASRIVRGLYPKAPYNIGSTEGLGVDDNPSVKLAQQWLEANPEAPSALRRLVLEAQDHGHRSIVAQKFNASLQAK